MRHRDRRLGRGPQVEHMLVLEKEGGSEGGREGGRESGGREGREGGLGGTLKI